ncbi:MAG TPA: threonine--tRNA ligase [Polyangiales bacterium]|nr:threonine--tRNA ligase [Polyangiales bacterium]
MDCHDHRQLAQDLDLLHFQDEAPGMAFFHPRGLQLYRLLEQAARALLHAHGYAEVKTPQLIRRPIWEQSGHWQHFRGNMFIVDDDAQPAALKPVSCPGHIAIVKHRLRSYRELPIRLGELGSVHRDELGGTLHGLLRLRQFTQDDGHVFCSALQLPAELDRFCAAVGPFYAAFGFERISLALATRPPDRFGADEAWDDAEAALAGALLAIGRDTRPSRSAGEAVGAPPSCEGRFAPASPDRPGYSINQGGGAFYGPKIEVALHDRLGRAWQCGTIQLDVAMPERFDLRYVDADGARKLPYMLHRALYGSLERFMGILLEHHGRALPLWLAPQQVAVLPVNSEQSTYAERVALQLSEAGLRAELDARDESLGNRIADAHALAVPLMLVLGAREQAAEAVALREAGGQRVLPFAAALAELQRRCAAPDFPALARGR